MTRITQFAVLSRLATLELLRTPILLALTVAAVCLSLLNPLFLIHPFGEPGKLARDGALAFHLMFGVFVAGFAACTAVSRTITDGTAAAVLSKPVARAAFLCSRFVAIVLVVVAYSACCAAALLLNQLLAHGFRTQPALILLVLVPVAGLAVAGALNFIRRIPFYSTAFYAVTAALTLAVAGAAVLAPERMEWQLLPASALIALALLVLSAIAVALSTRVGPAPTVTCLAGCFVAGLLSDYLTLRLAGSPVAAYACSLLPNWQYFWVSDALARGGHVSWTYMGTASAYAALYAGAALAAGVASFSCREVS